MRVRVDGVSIRLSQQLAARRGGASQGLLQRGRCLGLSWQSHDRGRGGVVLVAAAAAAVVVVVVAAVVAAVARMTSRD
jgi:hypothetical protein